MRTIETVATVTPERTVTIQLPPEVKPGEHKVVLVIEEVTERKAARRRLKLPKYSVGPWPEGLSLRREDMYGDDGR